jgi:aspartate beta-hydroxylase
MTHPTASNADAVNSLLAAARQQAEQGAILQADQLFQRVLDIAPDQYEALHFLGMRALAEGRTVVAKVLLERAVEQDGSDIQLLKNLGVACIGAERLDEARFALDRALTLAPDFFVAKLYLGYVLETLGHKHAALKEYFSAVLMAQAKGRWLSPETTAPPLRELVTNAMRFVDAGRKQLFSDGLAPLREQHGDDALRRVEHCLDIYLALAPAEYPNPLQKPKFLYFPDLPTTPYFARELFDWYAELERNTAVIRDELLAVLQAEQGVEPFLKFDSPDEVPKFLGAGPQGAPAWDAFFLYRHGVRYDDNHARCPRTSAIIEALPVVRIRAHAPEICFSVLAPGTHILPHHGVTNTRVVTHLPLIVPDDCALRVGGEDHAWKEGQCVTFDDTFEHEAWNRSDQTRVVLIIDGWNPHLTGVECDAITRLVEAIGDFNRECGVVETR